MNKVLALLGRLVSAIKTTSTYYLWYYDSSWYGMTRTKKGAIRKLEQHTDIPLRDCIQDVYFNGGEIYFYRSLAEKAKADISGAIRWHITRVEVRE